MLVTTLTVEEKYFVCNSQKLPEPFQMQLSKKQKNINFLLRFRTLHSILNVLKKNVTLVAYVFPKLKTATD